MSETNYKEKFDIIKQLYEKAINYQSTDPEASLQNARRTAEGICQQVYIIKGLDKSGKPVQKLMLNDLIQTLFRNKAIPPHITVPLGTIQAFGNFASHYQGEEYKYITEEYIKPGVEALTTVYNWFFREYQKNIQSLPIEYTYDIFICFANDDKDWAIKNLYTPLLNCKKNNNKRPNIFINTETKGIKQGENVWNALANVIKESEHILFVYSKKFFVDQTANWVLTKSFQLDPLGKKRKNIPILISSDAEYSIPFEYSHIQFLDSTSDGWFLSLIQNIEFQKIKPEQDSRLSFSGVIPDVYTNHTLPVFKIKLSNQDEKKLTGQEVEIFSSKGEISGTTKLKSENGIATFNDISFNKPNENIQLIAKAFSYKGTKSNQFSIKAHEKLKPDIKDEAPPFFKLNESFDDVLFFKTGKAIIVLRQFTIAVLDLNGKEISKIDLQGKIKDKFFFHDIFVLTDWDGRVYMIYDTGISKVFQATEKEYNYSIPANVKLVDDELYASFWNGSIWSYKLDKGPTLVYKHDKLIRDFDIGQNGLFIVDSNGVFSFLRNGRLEMSEMIEKDILGIKHYNNLVIIVGKKTLYQFSATKNKMIGINQVVDEATYVLFTDDRMLIIGEDGKGSWIDLEFVKLSSFSTTHKARPLIIDKSNTHVLFEYQDSTKVIMSANQINFSHKSGALSFDFAFENVLIGDNSGLNIYKTTQLNELSKI